jgi:hypothetical protein
VRQDGRRIRADRPTEHPLSDLPRPTATRLSRPRWLDARLVAGVLLILVSVVVGAKIVAEADDSYGVWGVRRDVGPRTTLTEADLVTRRVRLDGDAAAYVAADGPAPVGWTVTRPLGAGELLPRSALAAPGTVSSRRVAVSVDAVVAADLRPGSIVDVYVVPSDDGPNRTPARVDRVLTGVTVSSVERNARGLGGSSGGWRQRRARAPQRWRVRATKGRGRGDGVPRRAGSR